jgi:hypothetical protein
MSEPVLYRPSVVTRVGQRIAAAVAQHVTMHWEVEASPFTNALDQTVNRVGREGTASFGAEDEANCR